MYNAFVSYSHAADEKLAPALQVALEKFAKPWYKIRYLNIFRDEASLTASPHLWTNIKEALKQSEYLIYMASPKSASSKWIIKEIEFWLQHKSIETLLIVLTEGEIIWNPELKSFIHGDTNSLPNILQEQLTEEPFYIDLRAARSEVDLSLNNPIFKKEVLKLAAQLHGKQPKDLASEEVFAYRKMKRIRNAAIAILVFLFCVASASAWLANSNANKARVNLIKAQENQKKADVNAAIASEQRDSAIISRNLAAHNGHIAELQRDTAKIERNNAISQKQIAIVQRNKAQANYLWSQSKSVLSTDPTLALRLAEAAIHTFKDPEIEHDLRDIYYSNSFYKIVARNNTDPVKSYLAISPDHKKGFNITYAHNDFEWEEPEPVISDIKKDPSFNDPESYTGLTKAAFSPDGKRIVYCSKDGLFNVIDLNRRKLFVINMQKYQPIRNSRPKVQWVAFSKEERTILTFYDGTMQLLKMEEDTLLKKCKQDHISKIILSEDGNQILTGFVDGKVQLWNWDGKKLIDYVGQQNDISSLNFSPDKTKVIAGSLDSTVQIWNADGSSVKKLRGLPASVYSAIVSPGGDQVATVCDNNVVQLWNMKGKVIQAFKPPSANQCAVQYSSDGRSIITTAYNDVTRRWGIKTNIVKEYKFDSTQVRDIVFSPDGQNFVSTSANISFTSLPDSDLTIRIWDRNGNILKELKNNLSDASGIAFSPGGKTFAVIFNGSYKITPGDNDNYGSQAILWDLNGKFIRAFKSTSETITTFMFSPSGKKLFLGTHDGTVEEWDINGNLLYKAEASAGEVTSIAISPNEKSIYFLSEETGVRYPAAYLEIVDLNKNRTREIDLSSKDNVPSSIVFSSNGKNIIADNVEVWDLNGKVIGNFKTTGCEGSEFSVYSKDGTKVIASIDGDVNNDLLLKGPDCLVTDVFIGHEDRVGAVSISPDRKIIVSGGNDGKIIVWKKQMPLEVFLKSDMLDALSEDQRKKYNIDNFR